MRSVPQAEAKPPNTKAALISQGRPSRGKLDSLVLRQDQQEIKRWHHTIMISQEEIDRLKAENSPLEVALRHGLELKKQGTKWLALCPFHEEKSPSFTIETDHAHCYGCGWHGDSIKLEAALSESAFPEACKRLGGTESAPPEDEATRRKRAEERRQRQAQAETKTRAERAAKRTRWPQFCYGRTPDLAELAISRVKSGKKRLDYAGPWRAQELGHLYFATWRGHLAWIIGDTTCAVARRLDGKKWEHGSPHKSDTLPGSEKHPIGLTQSPLPAILVEGEPNYLAALARLWRSGQHDSWQVVCMLGTGANLGDYASLLAGRDVLIHPDGDPVGLAAGERWRDEAVCAGAKSTIVKPLQRDIDEEEVAA